jgi:ferric-dicitrate binding protein FerR (iron transport regulator)
MQAFKPNGGNAFIGSATTTSQNISLSGKGGYLFISRNGNPQSPLFVKAGQGTQTAANTDFAFYGDTCVIVKVDLDDDNVAILCSGSGPNVIITRGEI